MIKTKFIEEMLPQGHLKAKTLDSMFRCRIEEAANCSPFVSQTILEAVKEIILIKPKVNDGQLSLGQILLFVLAVGEPAGKPLEQCQKVTVRLTLDAGQEDFQLRLAHGVEGLRRARILRITGEAREHGELLSYEDLASRLFIPRTESTGTIGCWFAAPLKCVERGDAANTRQCANCYARSPRCGRRVRSRWRWTTLAINAMVQALAERMGITLLYLPSCSPQRELDRTSLEVHQTPRFLRPLPSDICPLPSRH